jgi:hypothetical protein
MKPRLRLTLLAVLAVVSLAPIHVAGARAAAGPADDRPVIAADNHLQDASLDRWRRTAHGWEWIELRPPRQYVARRLHPLTLAAFQLLASLGFLMSRRQESSQRTAHVAKNQEPTPQVGSC